MRVLIVGRWAKEEALARCLEEEDGIRLYAFMGGKNRNIAALARDFVIGDCRRVSAIRKYALSRSVDMAVVGATRALAHGAVDALEAVGIPCMAPTRAAFRLESDKAFVRRLMEEHAIAGMPDFAVFDDPRDAVRHLEATEEQVAVKPVGLTDGFGVKVMGRQLRDEAEAKRYVRRIFEEDIGGLPRVVIEERLRGEEFSLQAFVDGTNLSFTPVVRDYKLLEEGEGGINTGGMGSYSDADHRLPVLAERHYRDAASIMRRVIHVLREDLGAPYRGVLVGQFILHGDEVMLLEFNGRPGDPEFLNVAAVLETSLLDIFETARTGRLDRLTVSYENRATVCKYLIPEGYPDPRGPMRFAIDEEKVARRGASVHHSCAELSEGVYEPGPRGVAITGVGDTLGEADRVCEECIGLAEGDPLCHRRDIGTPALTFHYREPVPDREARVARAS